jgi:cytochrome c-type biogenesis protein CcmH
VSRVSGVPARPRGRAGCASRVLALVLLALWLLPAVAHADAADDAVRRVALRLQCPVCEGQSVWDSGSKLAADMRSVIRAKQAAGESDQQILDEFVAAYGDGILTEPPKRGISLGVWFGPVLILLAGAALLAALISQWRRPGPARGVDASPTRVVDPLVADELRAFREQAGGG